MIPTRNISAKYRMICYDIKGPSPLVHSLVNNCIELNRVLHRTLGEGPALARQLILAAWTSGSWDIGDKGHPGGASPFSSYIAPHHSDMFKQEILAYVSYSAANKAH